MRSHKDKLPDAIVPQGQIVYILLYFIFFPTNTVDRILRAHKPYKSKTNKYLRAL